MAKLYELGDLKNNPQQLYDIAIKFSQFYDGICPPASGGEIWDVLSKVNRSLWACLPPVITIDLSDPDEPPLDNFGLSSQHSGAGSARNNAH